MKHNFRYKSFGCVLVLFLTACQANSSALFPAAPVLSTSSPIPKTEFSTPTSASTQTSTSVPPTLALPSPTATPFPPERLAFVEGAENTTISFIYSDNSNFEQPELFEPFRNAYETRHLAISPNGRFLVFDGADTVFPCPVPDSDCAPTNYGLWLADLQENTITPLAIKDLTMKFGLFSFNLGTPSWSPDSKFFVTPLLFAPTRTESQDRIQSIHLFKFDMENRQWAQLTSNTASNLFPSWSPNNQWIAFIQYLPPTDNPGCDYISTPQDYEGCNHGALYVVRPDGSDLRLLLQSVYIEADIISYYTPYNMPVWSPDSQWIATLVGDKQPDLAIINVETGEVRVLAVSEYKEISPVWSPDGKQIAFVSDRDGNQEIYVISQDGMTLQNLTQNEAYEYSPAWSPSGNLISFLSSRDGQPRLYVMNRDGAMVTKLSLWNENELVLWRQVWFPDP
jgi:hypothetical protein